MKKSAVGSTLLTGKKRKIETESAAIAAALRKAGKNCSSKEHAEIIDNAIRNYRLNNLSNDDEAVSLQPTSVSLSSKMELRSSPKKAVEVEVMIDEEADNLYFNENIAEGSDDDAFNLIIANEVEVDPDIYDFQQQNMSAGEQTAIELDDLRKHKQGFKTILLTVWDGTAKCWTTRLGKAEIAPSQKMNFKITDEDMAEYKTLYCGKDVQYRSFATEIFPIEEYEGMFTFCGCAQVKCKKNVAASGHRCGYCLRQMAGFCLPSPGQWGCCRNCFITKHTTNNPTTDHNAPPRPLLNARSMTTVPKTPTNMEV